MEVRPGGLPRVAHLSHLLPQLHLLPLLNTLIFDVTGSFFWAWVSNIAMSLVTILLVAACYGAKKRTYAKIEAEARLEEKVSSV